MTQAKAIIFDFIGTLTNVKGYNVEDSKKKLSKAITEAGFHVGHERFSEAYERSHEKFRIIRYRQLVEVTNAIWISEALNNLGFNTKPEDTRIKTAVNIFFEDYVESSELRPCARKLLKAVSADFKLGLISNFTYAPVIHVCLRKLGINQFFSAILISEETGWRKPHPKIFEAALQRLNVTAKETVYVGDSPTEDIKGAKAAGMRTVFVASQFYSLKSLFEAQQKPDIVAKDVCELCKKLPLFLCKGVTPTVL
jgi:putative hydrolase of the HAD superfamily